MPDFLLSETFLSAEKLSKLSGFFFPATQVLRPWISLFF